MKTLLARSLARFALVAAGCGGGGGDGSFATVACTTGTGTDKTCLETSTNMPVAGGAAQAKMDCTNAGGVASDSCSHEGANGGCKMIGADASGATVSLTTWYYSGDADGQMTSCRTVGNTWIAP